MRVLIVYEEVPESVKLYDLEVSQEEFEKIRACHGHYANTVDEPPECSWLSTFLEEREPVDWSEPFQTLNPGIIIQTGFML